MHAAFRYVIATLLAVLGGFIGFHDPLKHVLGLAGSMVLIAGLFGLIAGLARVTGYFGNLVNAFFFTAPLIVLPGEYAVFATMWFWGNLGYAVGNVMGQIARLSIKVEIRSI